MLLGFFNVNGSPFLFGAIYLYIHLPLYIYFGGSSDSVQSMCMNGEGNNFFVFLMIISFVDCYNYVGLLEVVGLRVMHFNRTTRVKRMLSIIVPFRYGIDRFSLYL